jgi:hypothetical protein
MATTSGKALPSGEPGSRTRCSAVCLSPTSRRASNALGDTVTSARGVSAERARLTAGQVLAAQGVLAQGVSTRSPVRGRGRAGRHEAGPAGAGHHARGVTTHTDVDLAPLVAAAKTRLTWGQDALDLGVVAAVPPRADHVAPWTLPVDQSSWPSSSISSGGNASGNFRVVGSPGR